MNNELKKEDYVNNQISNKLYNLLAPLRDDKDYPLCILALLKTNENKKKLLDLIENGLNNSDEIILKTLSIIGRNPRIKD